MEFAASSMVEPEGRWARWIRLPMRVLSLRTIVIIGQNRRGGTKQQKVTIVVPK